jgi:membrane-anchored glycerophosphoryl diester phosphodiesterase (GDPDase)
LLPILGVGFLQAAAMVGVAVASFIPAAISFSLLWATLPAGFVAVFVLAVRWVVAVPATVIEHTGVFQSFTRSASLTAGYRWQLFSLGFVLFIALILTLVLLSLILGAVFIGGPGFVGTIVINLFSQLVSAFVSMFIAVATCVAYHDLRVVKEGVDTDTIAKIFD